MSNFLINILASLIGSAILIFIASLVSQQARWVLIGLLSHLLDVDIDFVFTNKAAAQSDLQAEMRKARDVAILAGRGNELQREPFASLFHERPEKRQVRVRILLPETVPRKGEYDWTYQREHELTQFDPAFGNGLLRSQIEASVQFFQQHIAAKLVELRRFNYPHIGRIVITERFMYYTPYRRDAHGRDSKVYKFRRGGEMYDNFSRLFEQLWEANTNSGLTTITREESVVASVEKTA